MFWLLNRLRGSANVHLTTTESRLIYWELPWSVVGVLLAFMYGLPWWVGLITGGLALGGMVLGHSFAQANTNTSEAEMGLVTYTRMTAILLPLILASAYYHKHVPPALLIVAAFSFFLAWGASSLSYSSVFQTRKPLVLFSLTLCVPGDSSWEELLVGAAYDFSVLSLVGLHYAGGF